MRMDSWGRQRSQRSKPPLGNWQPTVPLWEKKFCWEVGAVPWRKLLETKKLIHTYDNILAWKDSAAKEAFDNAKAHYWAGLNGRKYNIPKPDPNAHIDEVDWNDEIDPELILALDRNDVVSDDTSRESVVIFGEGFGKSQEVTDDGGWGEGGNDFKILTDIELEKIQEDCMRVYAEVATNEESKVQENRKYVGYNGNYRERSGGYMSRYKTTRFNGDGKINDGDYNRNCRNTPSYKDNPWPKNVLKNSRREIYSRSMAVSSD